MQNTSSNDTNTFYKTSVVDGTSIPYPPDPPAFCTRQSVKQMKDTSEELTKTELKKINENMSQKTNQLNSNRVTCVPSVEFNPDMHRIMCKYADKQQQLCNQICDINSRLQKKQDECIALKDTHQNKVKDLQDEIDHIQEINDGNEDELKELTETMDRLKKEYSQYKSINSTAWKYQPICVVCILFLYTILGFEMNKHFSFGAQATYNEYTSFFEE